MIWIILTFVFGWLLCGAWAIRADEKDDNRVRHYAFTAYILGPIVLIAVLNCIYIPKWSGFVKRFIAAWKSALKGGK